MSNRLAARRRMWLLVKAKEKELRDEQDKFKASIGVSDGELPYGEDSIPRSKRRSVFK